MNHVGVELTIGLHPTAFYLEEVLLGALRGSSPPDEV